LTTFKRKRKMWCAAITKEKGKEKLREREKNLETQ
jgi:hypothetical protein